jgi:hypothetical protein
MSFDEFFEFHSIKDLGFLVVQCFSICCFFYAFWRNIIVNPYPPIVNIIDRLLDVGKRLNLSFTRDSSSNSSGSSSSNISTSDETDFSETSDLTSSSNSKDSCCEGSRTKPKSLKYPDTNQMGNVEKKAKQFLHSMSNSNKSRKNSN